MDHGALPDQNGQGQRHHQRPQRLGHRTGQAEVHPRLAPERDNRQRRNSEDRERPAKDIKTGHRVLIESKIYCANGLFFLLNILHIFPMEFFSEGESV